MAWLERSVATDSLTRSRLAIRSGRTSAVIVRILAVWIVRVVTPWRESPILPNFELVTSIDSNCIDRDQPSIARSLGGSVQPALHPYLIVDPNKLSDSSCGAQRHAVAKPGSE